MSFSTTGSVVAGSINTAFNSNTLGSLITTGGNIGVGTTSPAYTLDVNGAVNGRSGYTGFTNGIPAVGNIGQIMTTTNGVSTTSGNSYWIQSTTQPSSSFTPLITTPPLSKGVYMFGTYGYFQQSGSGTAAYYVQTAFNTKYDTYNYGTYVQSQGTGYYASHGFTGTFNIIAPNTTFNLVAKQASGGGISDAFNSLWVVRIA